MPVDGAVLQNITIAITIVVVALVVALMLSFVIMRRIVGHNTRLAEAVYEEKEHVKIEREKLVDATAMLEQGQEYLSELERELSAAKQRLMAEELRIKEMERALSADDTNQVVEQQADEMVPMTAEQLMAHIDRRIEELGLHTNPEIKLKEIAKALGLTQRRILLALKTRAEDKTLAEYLTTKRLNTACRLLVEQPNWKIEAVASESGFGAVTTFRTIFRKHFGVSPSQYREAKIAVTGCEGEGKGSEVRARRRILSGG